MSFTDFKMKNPELGLFLEKSQKQTEFNLTTAEDKQTFLNHVNAMAEYIALHSKQCKISYVLDNNGLAIMSLRSV